MTMVYCRGCGKEIHETAPTCPDCGSPQRSAAPAAPRPPSKNGLLWIPITSLSLGLCCVLMLSADSPWDKDEIHGFGMFSAIGLLLGVVSLTRQKTGKRMAITGVIASSIALLAFLDMLSK